jgi:hypothetical protein
VLALLLSLLLHVKLTASKDLVVGNHRYGAMDMTLWLPQVQAVLAQVEGR